MKKFNCVPCPNCNNTSLIKVPREYVATDPPSPVFKCMVCEKKYYLDKDSDNLPYLKEMDSCFIGGFTIE